MKRYVDDNDFITSLSKVDGFMEMATGFLEGREKNNCLSVDQEVVEEEDTYFFLWKKLFPRALGRKCTMESSAKKRSNALQSCLLASNGLYFALSFEIPITCKPYNN